MEQHNIRSILVVAAMLEELIPFIKACHGSVSVLKKGAVVSVRINECTVYCACCGVGERNVKKYLPHIREQIKEPLDAAFFIGICGAVRSDLKVGDTVIPDCVISEDNAHSVSINVPILQNIAPAGTLMTVSKLYEEADKCAQAALNKELVAVDMEALHVVSTLDMPAIVLKAVSDTRMFRFPSVKVLSEHFSERSLRTIIVRLIKKPRELVRLLLLKRNTQKAIRSNTQYVKRIIEECTYAAW